MGIGKAFGHGGVGTGVAEAGADRVPQAVVIGCRGGRAEGGHPLAVGFDNGGIDAVHRRAAHQTQRPDRGEIRHPQNVSPVR